MNDFFYQINRRLDQFLTPAVKKIFIINVVIGLLSIVVGSLTMGSFTILLVRVLGLIPYYIIHYGCVWQFATYMFVHVQVMHLLFNMLVLWFFAPDLENRWGTRRFWKFYLTTGVGAGVLHFLVTMTIFYTSGRLYEAGPLIGASGALYGVMLAFAAYNPEAVILVYGVFPMKAKYLVALMAFMEFMFTASGNEGNVSNVTHLSGLVIAYIYLALYHKDWDIRHWQWR